jgi:hypothetical protein
MAWLRDPAWQQGLAILLVVAGAIQIYFGAAAMELSRIALVGVALFGIGIALPLISQAFRAHRENAAKCEDV